MVSIGGGGGGVRYLTEENAYCISDFVYWYIVYQDRFVHKYMVDEWEIAIIDCRKPPGANAGLLSFA